MIVSFPNFGHWSARLQVALGRMPVSETLPYEWYETPNVHHCTITDFEDLCRRLGVKIRERLVLHAGQAGHVAAQPPRQPGGLPLHGGIGPR